MAENVQINRLHNKEYTFSYGDNAYVIHLFSYNGFTFIDIQTNGNWICRGLLCAPNEYILPEYLQNQIGGNFMFNCRGEDSPAWSNFTLPNNIKPFSTPPREYPYFYYFNQSQNLQFVPLSEIEASL